VEHLDWFQSLAVVNRAAMNMGVQVAVLYTGTDSFGCMSKSGISELHESSIFSFLRNLHTAFHSGYTALHSQKQWISFLVLPHPYQYLLSFVLLLTVFLTGVGWNLSVISVCISFISKDVEHFIMCFLTICTSCFENFLFSSFAHLFSGFVDSLWG
jgi:hypothetical protein